MAKKGPRKAPVSDSKNPDLKKVMDLVFLKKYNEAQALAGTLSKRHPDESAFPLLQAAALMNAKNFHKAEKVLRKATSRFPDDFELEMLLGDVYHAMRDLPGAERTYAHLLTVMHLPPAEKAEVHCSLAGILWERSHREEALDHWREALKLDPDNKDARTAIAECSNAYGEPKAPTSALDDLYRFQHIHQERYLRLVGREEFETMEEAKKVLGMIMQGWNDLVAPRSRELDTMSAEEKSKLFESITLRFML